MVEPVNFDNAKLIIEYGPGTGVFTKEIISRKKPETMLILIEQNDAFFKKLSSDFHGRNNTLVIQGSAEQADKIAGQYSPYKANAVISGLPFTSLPSTVSHKILKSTGQLIGDSGIFVTFQYSRVKEKLFTKYFSIDERLHEPRNIPPAYVYVFKNKDEKGETN
ncbi:MAG: SAM-dependent methyltransferase [Lachnospiraceae bacterium]|nr:SAM-dependent methyltransferase [Lachnospiraceae bacterium]